MNTVQRLNSEGTAILDTDYCLLRRPIFSLCLGTYRIALQSFPRLGRKFCLVKKKVFLLGDLLKEDSESLNRSAWVFCWIRDEQRESWVPTLEDVCKRSVSIFYSNLCDI